MLCRCRHDLDADADGAGSFLRLVTSPKIFKLVTPIEDAVAFLDALLAAPGVHLAPVGPEWPKLRQPASTSNWAANDVPDAWLAAAVVQLGEHLVSFDRDFRKLWRAASSRCWSLRRDFGRRPRPQRFTRCGPITRYSPLRCIRLIR